MSMTDPIADMLTRIRNANIAYQEQVEVPSSKTKLEIARILKEEGYIQDYKLAKRNGHDVINVIMKYGPNREKVITGIKRISKPGLRVYARKDELPRVLGGLGIAILSTPGGIITAKQAKQQGVGGEVLCFVW